MSTVKGLLIAGALVLGLGTSASADTEKGREALEAARYDVALKELRANAGKDGGEAAFLLGRMYGAGLGVDKDAEKAVAYYGKAAEAGYPPAQREYGAALALGEGVEQDITEGLKWLIIAARQGNKEAKKYAAILAKPFPRMTVTTARTAAEQWLRERGKEEAAENELPLTAPER